MNPIVSVVVPAFNVAAYLDACLTSLRAQTYPHLEILIVDDGSTDESAQIADRIASQDPRFRVLRKSNGGLSDARNFGLAQVAGEYVMFLDSDDWADPDCVGSMLAAAQQNGVDLVIAGFRVDRLGHDDVLQSTSPRIPDAGLLVKGSPIGYDFTNTTFGYLGYAWNKLYRTSLLRQSGSQFPVGISLVEDVLFNSVVLECADRVLFLDAAFVHYNQRPRITLGTAFYDDYILLKIMARDALSQSLTKWRVPTSTVSDIRSSFSFAIVRGSALRIFRARGMSAHSRMRHLRAWLANPLTADLLRVVIESESTKFPYRVTSVVLLGFCRLGTLASRAKTRRRSPA